MKDTSVIPLHPMPCPPFYRLTTDSGITIPLFAARVQAGFPSPADDYLVGRIDLNAYISSNPTSTFLVKVEGDSMIGVNIVPGDLAVVDKSRTAKSGEIVLAFVAGEFTIKRLEIRADGAYLLAENIKYKPIRVTEAESGRVWGVVVGMVRSL